MTLWRLLFSPAALKGSNEDRRILEFFASTSGVFVEVGANEPVVGSQTYELEQKGWDGILVEPLRECVERLRNTRSAKVYEAAAGAPEDCGKKIHLLVAGALSTLGPII